MCLGEIRLQTQGSPELRSGFSSPPLRQENPTQKIVPLGVPGSQLDYLFKGIAGFDQIAALDGRHSLPIKGVGAGLLAKNICRERDQQASQLSEDLPRARLTVESRLIWLGRH